MKKLIYSFALLVLLVSPLTSLAAVFAPSPARFVYNDPRFGSVSINAYGLASLEDANKALTAVQQYHSDARLCEIPRIHNVGGSLVWGNENRRWYWVGWTNSQSKPVMVETFVVSDQLGSNGRLAHDITDPTPDYNALCTKGTTGGSNSSTPSASLTANGLSRFINLNTNSTVTYRWNSSGADSASSQYIVYPAYTANSNCGGFIGAGPFPWVANSLSGSETATAQSCQFGRIYVIAYTARSSTTGQSNTQSLIEFFLGGVR